MGEATYNYQEPNWRIRNAGGFSGGVSLGRWGLSVGMGAKSINLYAKRDERRGSETMITELELKMVLTGIDLKAELAADLTQKFTGISVARTVKEFDYVIPMINLKNTRPLKSHDITGPCSLVSFDAGKVHIGKERVKLKGETYLFLGHNEVIVDQSADWLQRVVDNANKATLGGNVIKFNENSFPFSNARAAMKIGVNDVSASASLTAGGVGLYSGTIKATKISSRKYD